MKLTELQLKIQEWSDKNLGFGCLVSSIGSVIVGYSVGKKVFWEDLGAFTVEKEQETNIIGHPMTYGRLCYLSQVNQNKNGFGNWSMTYAKMLIEGFQKDPEAIQQTVLDWSEELQDLVIAFLESLPNS